MADIQTLTKRDGKGNISPQVFIRRESVVQYVPIHATRKVNNPRKNPSDYCVKCEKFICKDSFENYHV